MVKDFTITILSIKLLIHWTKWNIYATGYIEYKVACLVHQFLHGKEAAYLANDINLVSDNGHRMLQSASDRLCAVSCTQSCSFGNRRFGVAGPCMWNGLPSSLLTGH